MTLLGIDSGLYSLCSEGKKLVFSRDHPYGVAQILRATLYLQYIKFNASVDGRGLEEISTPGLKHIAKFRIHASQNRS